MKKEYVPKKVLKQLQEEYNGFISARNQAFLEFMEDESSDDLWLKFKSIRDNLPELYRKHYNNPGCFEWRRTAITGVLQDLLS